LSPRTAQLLSSKPAYDFRSHKLHSFMLAESKLTFVFHARPGNFPLFYVSTIWTQRACFTGVIVLERAFESCRVELGSETLFPSLETSLAITGWWVIVVSIVLSRSLLCVDQWEVENVILFPRFLKFPRIEKIGSTFPNSGTYPAADWQNQGFRWWVTGSWRWTEFGRIRLGVGGQFRVWIGHWRAVLIARLSVVSGVEAEVTDVAVDFLSQGIRNSFVKRIDGPWGSRNTSIRTCQTLVDQKPILAIGLHRKRCCCYIVCNLNPEVRKIENFFIYF